MGIFGNSDNYTKLDKVFTEKGEILDKAGFMQDGWLSSKGERFLTGLLLKQYEKELLAEAEKVVKELEKNKK